MTHRVQRRETKVVGERGCATSSFFTLASAGGTSKSKTGVGTRAVKYTILSTGNGDVEGIKGGTFLEKATTASFVTIAEKILGIYRRPE